MADQRAGERAKEVKHGCREPHSRPQFAVGGVNPFKQYGPRVPAIVVSPYVEAGTVFRGTQGSEYDHTSILASLRDWLTPGQGSILGANPRIAAAPTFWGLLTRATPRAPEKPPALAADLDRLPADDGLTAGQREAIALGEAERQMVDAAHLNGVVGPQAEQDLADLAYALLAELSEAEHEDELPESLAGRVGRNE